MSNEPLSVDAIKPTRGNILVRPYRRPEKIGSIIVPEQARDNVTLTAWEFIRAGEGVTENWGVSLKEGDIVRTSAIGAIFVRKIDEVDYYMVNVSQVREVIPWQI